MTETKAPTERRAAFKKALAAHRTKLEQETYQVKAGAITASEIRHNEAREQVLDPLARVEDWEEAIAAAKVRDPDAGLALLRSHVKASSAPLASVHPPMVALLQGLLE